MPSRAIASAASLLFTACLAGPTVIPLRRQLTVKIGIYPRSLLDRAFPAPDGGRARGGRLYELFRAAGCRHLEVSDAGGSRAPIVTCTLPGETDETILVGANLEQPLHPRSVPDDWSSAVMLPSLFESMRVVPRRHTYRFIGLADPRRRSAFTKPSGLSRYLRRIPRRDRRNVTALVKLRGFTTSRTRARDSGADPNLSLDLHSVSRSLDLPLGRIRRSSMADLANWRSRIPNIRILVSDLEVGEYLDSYRLVAVYLGYLDQTLALRDRILGSSRSHSPPRS